MWENIKQFASDAWDNVQNAWRSAGEWFHTNITEPIGKFFSDTWDSITKAASEAWTNITNGIHRFWEDVKSWWNANVAKYFSLEYWKDLGKRMIDGLLSGLRGIFDGLSKWASDVWDSITGVFSGSKAKSSIRSGTGASSGSYSRVMQEMPATFSARDLPHLANGAVIPPNQQFAAILGDQRSGMNLEPPAGLIKQMVVEGMQAVMAQGGFGRGGDMTVIMEIDGREFGRASYKYGTAERQRVGVRLTEVRT